MLALLSLRVVLVLDQVGEIADLFDFIAHPPKPLEFPVSSHIFVIRCHENPLIQLEFQYISSAGGKVSRVSFHLPYRVTDKVAHRLNIGDRNGLSLDQ